MKYDKKVPEAVIRRLPRYYRYLSDLMQMEITRISSIDFSARMGITSSQVRQDFNLFGGFGLQGYGYDVKLLHREICNILQLNTVYNMVLIGVGHLGQALIKHTNFEKRGFKFIGIFDIDRDVIGKKIRDIEIMNLDNMGEFVKNNHVDIAAIAVPGAYAREVAKKVTDLGIKALWNFAPIELKIPDDVSVENIQLCDNLMVLAYKMGEKQ